MTMSNTASATKTKASTTMGMEKPFDNDHPNTEIDLAELWQAVWDGKKLIAIVTTLFATASVLIALQLPDIYRSEALLAPVSDESTSSLASLAGQLGGIASLAGINIGSSGDKSDLAIEILQSRHFLTKFIKNHDLLVPVCAATGWDEEKQKWILDENLYNSEKNVWLPTDYTREGKGPSDWEAVKAFKKLLTVERDKNTGFVTVGLELYSPSMAKKWMTWMIEELNQSVKARDIAEAEASISYLIKQADETSVADMRSVFYQLIEKQMQTITLANVRTEYVFEVIDPPVIPEEKTRPNRALICLATILFGGIVAAIWAIARFYRKVT